MLWVILLGLGPLAWAVQRLFWLQRRAAQGARGEERVGAALDTLQAKGWHVFHDLPLASVGNIDHLLVSAAGVFIVETKSHLGQITVQGGQLLRNGKPLEKDFLRQAKVQSTALSQILHQRLRQTYYVQPIVCFSQASMQVPDSRVEHVWVLPLAWLLAELEKQPPRLSPTQAHQVASVIRQLYASSR